MKEVNGIPVLGMGTWKMGENRSKHEQELSSLRYGLDHGMTLIDTAEMYGEGKSESLISEAIQGYDRSKLYIVDKVLPWNAGQDSFMDSLKGSLSRLKTDYIDLYLLHWRGEIPLEETIQLFEEAQREGLIRNWGVSNFDTDDMRELLSIKGGDRCLVDQCLYHLGSRGVEYDLLPFLKDRGIGFMAYCPLAMGGRLRASMLENRSVLSIAENHGITPMQVLLAFTLSRDDVISIPKASNPIHMKENIETLNISLTPQEKAMLNKVFPSPNHKVALDMQ